MSTASHQLIVEEYVLSVSFNRFSIVLVVSRKNLLTTRRFINFSFACVLTHIINRVQIRSYVMWYSELCQRVKDPC